MSDRSLERNLPARADGKTCSFVGCDRPFYARELCSAHYQQQKSGTSLKPVGKRRRMGSSAERDAQGRKHCSKCWQWLPTSEYVVMSSAIDGLFPHCRSCQRRIQVKTLYNLTRSEHDLLAASQGYSCAICGADGQLHVDHDHNCCPGKRSCGKCVRGLLCGPCNRAIGMFGDRIDRVENALAYLMETTSV